VESDRSCQADAFAPFTRQQPARPPSGLCGAELVPVGVGEHDPREPVLLAPRDQARTVAQEPL